ncbi:MAG: response regulator transcription factor [Ktedonobacterales bacterium]|nr:response regulator transcription factor [Ktedonobacterales bacterium]
MIASRIRRVAYVGSSPQTARLVAQTLQGVAEWEVVDLPAGAPLLGVASALPEVAVVDLHAASPTGWEWLSYIRVLAPMTHVVVLVATANTSLVLAAIQAGALGWLDIPQIAAELPATLQRAWDRRGVLTPALARLIQRHYAAVFLPHERAILAAFARGHSFPVVAATLDIEAPYLERHIGNILLKLMGIPDADALAAVAEELATMVPSPASVPPRDVPSSAEERW